MRGLHATLAVEAGVIGDAAALALGHEDFNTTTTRHYAQPSAVSNARQRRVEATLSPSAPSDAAA